MWIELREPITGLFFPSETLSAGAVISTGNPKGEKLVCQGKAIQVAFPASGNPDDLSRLRKQYREANGPLWDELPEPTATTVYASAGLVSSIEQKLGSRSAKNWRERATGRESRRGESVTTAELFKQAAKRLAAGRSVTKRVTLGMGSSTKKYDPLDLKDLACRPF